MRRDSRDLNLTSWRRLQLKLRGVGLGYVAQILLQKLIPRSVLRVRSLIIVRIDLSDRMDQPAEPEIRWVARDDLERVAAFSGRPLAFLRDRFDEGNSALITERGGRILGIVWYHRTYCRMDDWLAFVAPPDAIMGTGAHVATEARGQRLFPRMEHFAAVHFGRAGYSQMFGWIEALNRNMRRAHRAAGGKPVGRVLAVRCFGFGMAVVNGSPRLGRWTAKRPLKVDLDAFSRPRPPQPGR